MKIVIVCKMYFYSELNKDYETQYELYTTHGNYFMWTKEEELSIPDSERINNFESYLKVYDLNVEYRVFDKIECATVIWKTEDSEYLTGFSLKKENDIWKVCFLPIQ